MFAIDPLFVVKILPRIFSFNRLRSMYNIKPTKYKMFFLFTVSNFIFLGIDSN